MNSTKMKTIFSQRLCGSLMMRGFVLVDMRPNTDGTGRNVFFFNDTPELNNAIAEYKANGKL